MADDFEGEWYKIFDVMEREYDWNKCDVYATNAAISCLADLYKAGFLLTCKQREELCQTLSRTS